MERCRAGHPLVPGRYTTYYHSVTHKVYVRCDWCHALRQKRYRDSKRQAGILEAERKEDDNARNIACSVPAATAYDVNGC
jgi:hypothetical protein